MLATLWVRRLSTSNMGARSILTCVTPFVGIQSHEEHRSLQLPSPGLRLRHTKANSGSTFVKHLLNQKHILYAMSSPPELGDVTRLSEHVVRVLGQNPGKFTLQGTNTYLVGSQNPYILIDTAEGLPSYIPVLESALQNPTNATQPDVSDIILSHWHHDHVGGLPAVLILLKQLWEARNPGQTYLPPRLHKFPLKEGTVGNHLSEHNQLPKVLEKLTPDLFTPPSTGDVFHDLYDRQDIQDPSNGATLLRVLHTPGHTVDSICLYIPQDRALYTADTVLGHGTAVFEDLATYLASLNKMLRFGSPGTTSPDSSAEVIDLEYVALYPAHGAVVVNGRETISAYIKHRLEREAQILDVLQAAMPADLVAEAAGTEEDDGSLWSTWTIVRILYKSYPENLWLPAARGVDLHLRKLEGDGFVKRHGGEGVHTKWRLLISPPSTSSL